MTPSHTATILTHRLPFFLLKIPNFSISFNEPRKAWVSKARQGDSRTVCMRLGTNVPETMLIVPFDTAPNKKQIYSWVRDRRNPHLTSTLSSYRTRAFLSTEPKDSYPENPTWLATWMEYVKIKASLRSQRPGHSCSLSVAHVWHPTFNAILKSYERLRKRKLSDTGETRSSFRLEEISFPIRYLYQYFCY